MAAARAAVNPDLRRVAVPRRRFRLQPPHAVVGVLHACRVRRFRRERHVDCDHQHAARRDGAVHRFLGRPILSVPRAAVQIEHGGERTCALGPIDAGHQRPAGAVAPELDLVDRDLEGGGRIVCRRRARARRSSERIAGGGDGGQGLEKLAASRLINAHAVLRREALAAGLWKGVDLVSRVSKFQIQNSKFPTAGITI
jgi:hypothetical protein